MDHLKSYSEFLKNKLELKKPIKIVFDASNGATGKILRETFENYPKIEAIFINNEADPDFSAHGPNPLEPGAGINLEKKTKETEADLGVVFDADGDRAFFADNSGELLSSYLISLLLFKNQKPPFVVEEIVFQTLRVIGDISLDNLIVTKVGSLYIKEAMRKRGASVGAEYSGHYYFKDFFYTDSGILTAIKIINTLSVSDFTLKNFKESLPNHKIVTGTIPVKTSGWPKIKKEIKMSLEKETNIHLDERDGITVEFSDSWLNIRPSNTEPLARLMAGAPTQEQAEFLLKKIINITN